MIRLITSSTAMPISNHASGVIPILSTQAFSPVP
jgi:hypothetical protein